MTTTLHVTESNTVVSPTDSTVTLEISSNTVTLELADTLSFSSMTAGDILASIKTVDGTGSGLDADTVDGSHASAFEPSLGNPPINGYVLSSTAAGTRSWVSNAGGGGASDVAELTTTTGSSTNMVRVAAGGGLEYRTTAQVLSDIGGAASSHTHTESEITDLGDYAASSHTHTEADITDLGSYLTTVAIDDVSDIVITTPADNEVLAYDSGGNWINQTPAEAGLAEASHTHTESDITDLGSYEPALGNPGTDGYVLSSTAAGIRSWVANSGGGASDVDELTTATGSSTNMVRVAAGGGLEYRTTAQVLSDIGAAASSHTHTESDITDLGSYLTTVAINDVSDIVITTPADNEVLAYDSGGNWINQTPAEAGLAEASHTHVEADITDLGDYADASHTHVEADITDLGSYLTTVAINDVSDIVITTPADNEVLAYDSGGNWINQTPAEAGLAEASHTHAASDVTSGTFDNALVAESNVTQHQGAIDHGSIAGLGDDDHTQYALLAGRSGGTTLYGGTAAADDFTIDSTSNATKGDVVLQPSGGNVGIGTTSPQVKTHISVGSHGTFQSTFGVALAVESSAQARIGIFTPNTGAGILSFGDPQDHDIGMLIYDHSNNAMQMYVNAAERMRIDSSGNVGIGTTALTAKLQVNGSIAIVDGMTAPSTISGYAVIYVDSSDGDLKVKFGNGTVKTIVTDT